MKVTYCPPGSESPALLFQRGQTLAPIKSNRRGLRGNEDDELLDLQIHSGTNGITVRSIGGENVEAEGVEPLDLPAHGPGQRRRIIPQK